MIRRWGALGAVSVLALVLAAALPGGSAWGGADPTVSLSTTQVVPGQAVTVTGTGWPDQTRVQAALCGNDAVGGTVTCANSSTAAMSATSRGLLWSQIMGAIPPAPCPCVVLVTAQSLGYSRTIPVTVEGAASAPVTPPKVASQPTVTITSLHVYGTTTLASAMGASSKRSIEFRLSNPGTTSVTPVLFGYWGRGDNPTSTIHLPKQGALGPGKNRTVEGSFEVPAFSVGTYTVKVKAQLVGYPQAPTATTTFGQWPVGLLALGAILLLVVLYLLARASGRRRARRRDQRRQELIRPVPPAPDPISPAAGP
ncbi:MAG TPA: hypothetical protein VMB82_07245, partial [Acidimicrobiales bacterium]|nr:hypothetical protein [Acidimicrobiales bacterium]